MLVSIADTPSPEMAATHGVQQCPVDVQIDAEQLAALAQIVDAGLLKPVVSRVLPLQEARQAHLLSESRHTRGKIVLQVVA
jgi:NADPH:quinone reductase-like Zn-dependent oxidoreductase